MDQLLVSVSVPLYQSGAEYSRVRAQKETAGQRRLEADQARTDVIQTSQRAWNAHGEARAFSACKSGTARMPWTAWWKRKKSGPGR
ncbi:MAG: hypothetical protein H7Z12_15695 [Rhodospirillaceae bacterium]|nr:hypothetical protein [Rhodospirillales bacterium]